MRMKAEDKAKWLEALRSGEYKQTDNTLCNGTAYCCLGVLEVVLDGKVEQNPSGSALGCPTTDFLARHSIEIELRTPEGRAPTEFPAYDYNGTFARLIEMNDALELDDDGEILYGAHVNTFKDIANYIEQNVEVYE